MPDSYAILTEAGDTLITEAGETLILESAVTETWCERTEVMGVGIG